jgi:hypothetical protein
MLLKFVTVLNFELLNFVTVLNFGPPPIFGQDYMLVYSLGNVCWSRTKKARQFCL